MLDDEKCKGRRGVFEMSITDHLLLVEERDGGRASQESDDVGLGESLEENRFCARTEVRRAMRSAWTAVAEAYRDNTSGRPFADAS